MSVVCGECAELICTACGECINTSECEWAVYGCYPDRATRLAQVPLERMVHAAENMGSLTSGRGR